MVDAWKDENLLAAIARLREAFGAEHIAVVDHWPEDGFAVGVERADAPGVLAYLTCDEHGHWFVALELPPGAAEVAAHLPYREVGWHSGISLDQVVEIVGRHLGLVCNR